ncbi:MAG: thioredoxin domain-containing protein [Gemmatimonadota bacterium]
MTNRLARETSPYLLQHADNPVDWYPWGSAALSRALAEDRPILLSIGYSSCHWCHVMERESFSDPSVAARMNESFVNIKVDREERPDLDQVYMRAVQAMTGQGGWPLTVFLTPEGEPFYGGTYFPPAPRHGMPSFPQVLEAAARAYRDRPLEVRQGAGELRAALRKGMEGPDPGGPVGEALVDGAVTVMERQYDTANGGFGSAPKFPQPVTLEVLLRHHARTGSERSLDMALHTLRRMAAGGIRDHLGGGFHRYSVDARWLVPHFEKMLYDNVLLARVYVDAYKLTGAADLREVAEDTLDYVLSDMRAPDGGFYSARDADSEGREGTYYLWSLDEVLALLGQEEGRLVARAYDVTRAGNFEGRNILWQPHDVASIARSEGASVEELHRTLAGARERLREARSMRTAPFRDEKILVGWNGMALRALVEAGACLGRDDYVRAATQGAGFILANLRPAGRLLHVYTGAGAAVHGFLEDHAALGNAFVSLHEATLRPEWLAAARWCCDEMIERFWDPEQALFYEAPHDGEELFLRARDPMDNATPSGNSLAAELLLRAGHVFDDERYRSLAARVVEREGAAMARFPTAFGRLLCVADRAHAPPVEVAILGHPGDPGTGALVSAAACSYQRNLTIVGGDPSEGVPDLPLLDGRGAVDGRPTAYLCRSYACRAPVTDAALLGAQLDESARPADPRAHGGPAG